jgi:hypothetical protein
MHTLNTSWRLGIAAAGAFVALTAFGLPARADELVQHLGPVGAHVGCTTIAIDDRAQVRQPSLPRHNNLSTESAVSTFGRPQPLTLLTEEKVNHVRRIVISLAPTAPAPVGTTLRPSHQFCGEGNRTTSNEASSTFHARQDTAHH